MCWIAPEIPQDLQNVCLKALEKDAGQRYSSARALADDLERFLAGEPVHADPGAYSRLISGQVAEHLRELVLRITWDDATRPAVECPVGDFFAQGHGKYVEFDSAPVMVGAKKALNCYWPMPFRKHAVLTERVEIHHTPNTKTGST